MVVGVGVSVSLVLFALNKNINLYYTPNQLNMNQLPKTNLRIGGLVKKNSIKRDPDSLKIDFIITDYKREIPVTYVGVLPSFIREGQGVVIEGHFVNRYFDARQVLAKHDEKYMPPGLVSPLSRKK